jgi:hypothetical protein
MGEVMSRYGIGSLVKIVVWESVSRSHGRASSHVESVVPGENIARRKGLNPSVQVVPKEYLRVKEYRREGRKTK